MRLRATRREARQIYRRDLPGGGFVAIEVTPVRGLLGRQKYNGELVVERRIERERRQGHEAPAIAQVEAELLSAVLNELFPIAQSNGAIAAGCLAWQREQALADETTKVARPLARQRGGRLVYGSPHGSAH